MKFVAPEMEVKMFSAQDILTDSQGSDATDETTEMFQPDCDAELPMDWG